MRRCPAADRVGFAGRLHVLAQLGGELRFERGARLGTADVFPRLYASGPISRCLLNVMVTLMINFANASFSPEKIEVLTSALEAAVDTLPEPVSSHLVHRLAEAILRAARDGEFNVL